MDCVTLILINFGTLPYFALKNGARVKLHLVNEMFSKRPLSFNSTNISVSALVKTKLVQTVSSKAESPRVPAITLDLELLNVQLLIVVEGCNCI